MTADKRTIAAVHPVTAGRRGRRRNGAVEARSGSGDLTAISNVSIVERLVRELFDLACQGPMSHGLAIRRPGCHVRQITMYLCRVVLSMRYQQIAAAVERDRSTVIHGCAAVEDRRDHAVYDGFIDRCERCVRAAFRIEAEADHAA